MKLFTLYYVLIELNESKALLKGHFNLFHILVPIAFISCVAGGGYAYPNEFSHITLLIIGSLILFFWSCALLKHMMTRIVMDFPLQVYWFEGLGSSGDKRKPLEGQLRIKEETIDSGFNTEYPVLNSDGDQVEYLIVRFDRDEFYVNARRVHLIRALAEKLISSSNGKVTMH